MKNDPMIKCQFKGCSGEIDLVSEMRNLLTLSTNAKQPKLIELSWCIHTIICPKCMNPVGHITIGPDVWHSRPGGPGGKELLTINNTRNGKKIELGNGRKNLDPYLKKWAQID